MSFSASVGTMSLLSKESGGVGGGKGCVDASAYTVDALTRVKPIDLVVSESLEGGGVAEGVVAGGGGSGDVDDGVEGGGGGGGGGGGLAKKLSLLDLMAYGVGCTVGAGIYSLLGPGAQVAGPAVLLSFLLGAVSCALTGLAYSEFAARCPVSGSAYTYAYTSFGEALAWVIGWNLTLEYAISAAAIARSWGDYVSTLADLIKAATTGDESPAMPLWLHGLPLGGGDPGKEPFSLSVLAALVVVACTGVMLFGVQESARFNLVVTAANVCVLVFVICAGAVFVRPENWTTEHHSYVPYGPASVFAGAGTVFFSFLGFDMVSSLAEEVRNPQRDMPIGIIGSLSVSGAIYVGVSLVVTGMLPFTQFAAVPAPLAFAFQKVGLPWASWIVSIGSVFGLTAAAFTCLLGQPRIFYRMAKDGLLFPMFQNVDKNGVPWEGTIITGLITAAIALFLSLEALANAISVGTLCAFSLVNAGVVTLRLGTPASRTPVILQLLAFSALVFLAALGIHLSWSWWAVGALAVLSLLPFALLHRFPTPPENLPSTFQCPLVPTIPLLAIAINLTMLAGLKADAWFRLAIWTAIGIALYLLYGIRYSILRSIQPEDNKMSPTAQPKHLQETQDTPFLETLPQHRDSDDGLSLVDSDRG